MTYPPPPLDMNGAAVVLGVSRRTMDEIVKKFRHFEWRGNRRVFYPEHIAAIRSELDECGSKSCGEMAGRTPAGPDPMVFASDALSKLKTLAERRKRAQT